MGKSLNPEVPEALERIISKALEKDREVRDRGISRRIESAELWGYTPGVIHLCRYVHWWQRVGERGYRDT